MANQEQARNPDAKAAAPQTALEFFESGWTHYGEKAYDRAAADFQKTIDLSPNDTDAYYGLGMAYQAGGQAQEAIAAFQKVIALLEDPAVEDTNRARMLSRFAQGHINRITTGDWHMGQ